MLNLMYITNNPSLARMAVEAGVDRIFVDLEILGKMERQGHLSTVISRHTIEDVHSIRKAVPDVALLVRINPFHEGSAREIEQVLSHRPQMIMLPMYKRVDDVQKVSDMIRGRAALIPLLETAEALEIIAPVASISGVSEMYLGLNDLHLSLGRKFMFEFIADGTVEKFASQVKSLGKKFGFGGIARVGEGLLPAEHILKEHDRLGSSSVILSRTFHREANSVESLSAHMDFEKEVEKLRKCERDFSLREKKKKINDYKEICAQIKEIVKNA